MIRYRTVDIGKNINDLEIKDGDIVTSVKRGPVCIIANGELLKENGEPFKSEALAEYFRDAISMIERAKFPIYGRIVSEIEGDNQPEAFMIIDGCEEENNLKNKKLYIEADRIHESREKGVNSLVSFMATKGISEWAGKMSERKIRPQNNITFKKNENEILQFIASALKRDEQITIRRRNSNSVEAINPFKKETVEVIGVSDERVFIECKTDENQIIKIDLPNKNISRLIIKEMSKRIGAKISILMAKINSEIICKI